MLVAVSPVIVGEQRIRLSANIGFIVTTETHKSEDEAMRDADVALQEAKARGPNNAKAWEPALTSGSSIARVPFERIQRGRGANAPSVAAASA